MSEQTSAEIIRTAIRQLFQARQVVELRVPKLGQRKTISGYFDDFEVLEKEIIKLDKRNFQGIYYTLNVVDPALLARAQNHLQECADLATKDADILRRRWFLIDIDPVRPAGISSTNAEKAAANAVAMRVYEYLRSAGWPDPLVGDSANGYHLLYRVDLANDDSRDLLAGCLKALAAKFDQPSAKIDVSVFNASRIVKAYGSLARKGDSTLDRPHRRSQLLTNNLGTPRGIVSAELLHALAAEAPAEAKGPAQGPAQSRGDGNPDLKQMEKFLETYELAHDGPVPFQGGTKWRLCECVFNPEHQNAAVFISEDGVLGYHCFHDSCRDKAWKQARAELEKRTDKTFFFTHPTGKTEQTPATDDLSDCGNADRLVAAEGENLRYCHRMGAWHIWDGRRWELDEGEAARALMEKVMRAFVADVVKAGANKEAVRFAASCLDAWRITNGLREAQKKLAISAAELDSHPFLLTFANGTLDLATGELHPHNRRHFITKLVHYDYNPEARCPRFLALLTHAVGEAALPFIQKLVGYSLTADTSEKVFIVVYGPADTGKTTFLQTLRHLIKEHSVVLQVGTLMERQKSDNAIQEDLADLRGARLAITSELDMERRLSISTIKRICQGQGEIAAARKYEHKITFAETHKLWFDTNFLPIIPPDDTAVWNRLTVVAFKNPLAETEQNKYLGQELLTEEGEGILAWAVQGELARRRDGLGEPPAGFTQERSAWLEQMDDVKRFVNEACWKRPEARHACIAVYQAFLQWMGARPGHYTMSRRKFTQRLEKLGYPQSDDRRFYLELGLLEPEEREEP